MQSAMSEDQQYASGPAGVAGPQLLREAVLLGPGGRVAGGLRESVWQVLTQPAAVRAALVAEGHVDVRKRVLTGEVTVAAVLGLCLFSGQGAASVLPRVVPALAPGASVPSASALSQARARLAGQPTKALFEATAGRQAATPAPGGEPAAGSEAAVAGATAFGLELTAFDGTCLDLAATAEIAEQFAVPSGGRYPQARLVTLASCGTRHILAAAADSYATSEQKLFDQIVGALHPGTLNLADRNFFSMARWVTAAATGAQLAWRVKNGARSLPAKRLAVLSDGSSLLRLRESNSMLAARRAAAGDRSLPRLPDTRARLVEFDVQVADSAGRRRTSRFRVLTTLTDHHTYPAKDIAAVYAERWQVELAYYRIKVTLRGPGVVLRGQTPALARQEIWGLLVVYNRLCDLAARTAADLGVDPDEICFVAVLRHSRSHLETAAHRCTCTYPGQDATQALLTAIAAYPRNRTGRQRTSPRTTSQRRTERTRNVTYTINIITSNLPEAA
jgi:Insertion element 4 transposase N-terminal/Transposase DDE domain